MKPPEYLNTKPLHLFFELLLVLAFFLLLAGMLVSIWYGINYLIGWM